ncbi:zinc ABC transporter substrate-binding protein [Nitrosopumilus sp. K4]|uniref:metal ABC transporter substrate-binding protein n=1 Tax=Nitrosopumilus sp. K4 TaxID=2795383 RepID=UPI001BA636AD|nr:metal ABC transporter substrate-binding protein [Nitrosopumilus sp. K4]QUC64720.1 zinc ABC transporter substrate-binding protein [Nitrosopumilus sp. K4]
MTSQVKMAIIAIIIVIPLTSFVVYATDSKIQQENVNDKLTVMSSFYPLHEFAKKIGQDKVDAELLVPVGVEPHEWEPTIQDIQRMQKADLIIINGIGFENWVKHLEEINFQGNIVDTSSGITIKENVGIETFQSKDEHDFGDPHIWLNPVLVKTQVQNMANAFSNSDPQNEKFYQNNAKNFKDELDLLDRNIRNDLSSCNRDFIAFHNAFSYFADEYDLNQHTIISTNDPHSEPTARTLENVINTARELNLKIIFTEETADPRTSQIIADEIGGKILVLSPIEIGNDKSYVTRMTENLNNLKEALC